MTEANPATLSNKNLDQASHQLSPVRATLEIMDHLGIVNVRHRARRGELPNSPWKIKYFTAVPEPGALPLLVLWITSFFATRRSRLRGGRLD